MSEEVNTTVPAVCNNRLPRRIKLTDQQLEKVTLEELIHNWHEQDLYIDILEGQTSSQEGEITSLRESEERMRQQHLESTHREKVLVRRLASKEQEMQEYVSQIAEFKAGQTAGSSALRSALLDPAVNLLLQLLRGELISTRTRLEETQNELSAWKFTPDSNTGKRLMAKCRLLYQENEELGRMISSGRLAKLEGELALQKSFSDEVKKSQSELDEFLQDLDEDVEGMQSTIYYLQQELRKSKEAYITLQQQKTTQPPEVCNGSIAANKAPLNMKDPPASSSVEIKAEPEPFTSKPSSPLLKDEPVSQPMTVDVSTEDRNEKIQEESLEVQNVKSEPSEVSGETTVAGPELSSEEKVEQEEKVVTLEENAVADSKVVEVVREAVLNENNGVSEVKEETYDQDSQGELMIEVGSEPRDTEDEEAYGKTKEEDKLVNIGPVNGTFIQKEVDKEEEDEDDDQPLRRKRAAPEPSTNSSDEDSDDTPLIKKVRRNHELATKSKA